MITSLSMGYPDNCLYTQHSSPWEDIHKSVGEYLYVQECMHTYLHTGINTQCTKVHCSAYPVTDDTGSTGELTLAY